MTNQIIIGVAGSGKTTRAKDTLSNDCIYLTHHVTADTSQRQMTAHKFIRTFSNMRPNSQFTSDVVCKHIASNHIMIDEVEEIELFTLQCVCTLLIKCGKRFRITLCMDTSLSEVTPRQLVNLFSACTDHPWRVTHSSHSHRVPRQIGEFANLVVHPTEPIDGIRSSSSVTVSSLNINDNVDLVCDRVSRYASRGSVLLVSRSTTNNSELTKVCNELTNKWNVRIRCASVHNEDSCASVEFCSMAACRPFEADCVVVFGFLHGEKFRQSMYFALTRARKELFVVHSARFEPFHDLVDIAEKGFAVEYAQPYERDVSATIPVQWTPVSSLVPPAGGVAWGTHTEQWKQLCTAECGFDYSTRIRIAGTVEDVSHIYGILIPSILEHERTGRCKGVDAVLGGVTSSLHFPKTRLARLHQLYHHPAKCLKVWAEIALHLSCFKNYHYVMQSICHFEWVNEEVVRRALDRMRLLIPRGTFEQPLSREGVIGRVDLCAENGDLWEFKFTNELQKAHFYQTYTYGRISALNNRREVRVYLFNVRTCELWSNTIRCDDA